MIIQNPAVFNAGFCAVVLCSRLTFKAPPLFDFQSTKLERLEILLIEVDFSARKL